MSRALRSGEAEVWTGPLKAVHITRLLSVSKQFRARYLSLVRRSSINTDWAMLKLTVDSPGTRMKGQPDPDSQVQSTVPVCSGICELWPPPIAPHLLFPTHQVVLTI